VAPRAGGLSAPPLNHHPERDLNTSYVIFYHPEGRCGYVLAFTSYLLRAYLLPHVPSISSPALHPPACR
jgi:hypothetical protein